MPKQNLKIFFIIITFFINVSCASAIITVSEDFNDQNVGYPIQIYQIGGYCTSGCSYVNEVYHGANGYALKGDHAGDDELRMSYSDLDTHLVEGLYFRY
ncbi:MAG: hypothetical protein V3574_00110 [Candidatus Moraniibacteriota bacterium]